MDTHELFNHGPREARRKATLARDIAEQHTHPWKWPFLRAERFAREQPVAAVLAAMLTGLLAGLRLCRK